jgi:hypothetical protein
VQEYEESERQIATKQTRDKNARYAAFVANEKTIAENQKRDTLKRKTAFDSRLKRSDKSQNKRRKNGGDKSAKAGDARKS